MSDHAHEINERTAFWCDRTNRWLVACLHCGATGSMDPLRPLSFDPKPPCKTSST